MVSQELTTTKITPKYYVGKSGMEFETFSREFISKIEDGYIAHRIASAMEYLVRAEFKHIDSLEDYEKAISNIQQVIDYKRTLK